MMRKRQKLAPEQLNREGEMGNQVGNFLSLEPGREIVSVDWKDGGARSVYQAAGKVPHVCKDGREIELRVWSSMCWVCGCAFKMATPMSVPLEKTTFTRRCCDEHKSTPEQRKRNAAIGRAEAVTAKAKPRRGKK